MMAFGEVDVCSLSGSINMFALMECEITEVPIPDGDKAPSREIFAQPIIYPSATEHPLSAKAEALDDHIQAFLTG